MDKHITEDLVVVERQLTRDRKAYWSRYKTNYFIEPEMFRSAIKNLGGSPDDRMIGTIEDETVEIFSGYTWISVRAVGSYEDCDMWAERFEQALFGLVGNISPVNVHYPVPGLHNWGIEFNRNRPFWENSAEKSVEEAHKSLGNGWFYQSGSDHPDKGYQFFEFLGAPADSSGFQEEPEYVARCCAVKIARALGTIAMWDPAK